MAGIPIELPPPHRIKSVDINVTVDPYDDPWTRNVYLPVTTDLHDGDLVLISLFMPASELPTIKIRNAAVDATELFSWAGDAQARTLEIKCRFNGTAWEVRGWYEVNGTEGSEYRQSAAASAAIDMAGDPYQTLSVSANFTLSTTNKATAGRVREVAVLVTNTSGGTITVGYATGIKKPSSAVVSMAAGSQAWFSLTSMGPTEAETHCGSLVVS